MKRLHLLSILLLYVLYSCQPPAEQAQETVQILPPDELYGQLFYDVQTRTDLFPDSKTFVDCIPKASIAEITEAYAKLENKDNPDVLKGFLEGYFYVPGNEKPIEVAESTNASEHIRKLWAFLERPADDVRSGTLIPLPNNYIVPGGRFREVYYWDSYFTMLGLQVDGKVELMDNILANFSYLIDSIGFIPNGNRTYYNGRSQPPFFAAMVDLHVSKNQTKKYSDYLSALEGEYNFWMTGSDQLKAPGDAIKRTVQLDGGVLNRYWDNYDSPRMESYREDVETVEKAVERFPEMTKATGYRHLRAGAESGWDYTTRWFELLDSGVFDLSTIHTTDIIPVDLNSLLFNLEITIAKGYADAGDSAKETEWKEKAKKRRQLIIQYCWNDELGFYMDYDFKKGAQTSVKSLAGMYPLFFELAEPEHATRAMEVIEAEFLMPGGVVTTLNPSGQQWDYPNGWAPLQWITIKGIRNYDDMELAEIIATRWLDINDKVFKSTGKMTEKYNVVDLTLEGGGGEYPNQDGFGWTNGVYQMLRELYGSESADL